ncbi:histidine kinase [uncultured Chitinophaga sp.]|uniref:sensor histidine kinase n=1 Tax=uncultured Chitinophaga sp. TaxID=339340 RepID=UPI00261CBDE8|nr:histidine kinase [uncultured Chitinophaga sp.]
MKRFYPLTGAVIAFFIALLGQVLRTQREEVLSSWSTMPLSFVNAFLSWCWIQYVLQRNRPSAKAWKALLSVSGCVIISIALFFLLRDVAAVRNRMEALQKGMGAVYAVLVARGLVVGSFLYFIAFLLWMAAQRQQARLENERLQQEHLKARLSLLQEQISPHFLFNSLGTLRSMVEEPAARDFIQRLSEVYRYLLGNRMAELVALHVELDFIRAYLHILQERFEDALVTDIRIPASYHHKKIPPATLQLLIENAVKHNVASPEMPLRICIHAAAPDRLVVSNSLQRKNVRPENIGTGTGLSNIRERYRILAGRDIDVTEEAGKFSVSVFLLDHKQ